MSNVLLGENRDIFFPKLSEDLHLTTFFDIATRHLCSLGYEAVECGGKDEARQRSEELISQKKWPCYFFKSDTTGEKDFKEFFTLDEILDMEQFQNIDVIKNEPIYDNSKLEYFLDNNRSTISQKTWGKYEIVELFNFMIPDFLHKETGKYLDQRM